MTHLKLQGNETKQFLINEALVFSKHNTCIEAMTYVNDILEELKWIMKNTEFVVFKERILNEIENE